MTTSSDRVPYCKCAFTDPDGTFVAGEACQIHPDIKPQRAALTSKERGTRLFEQLESLRGQVTGALKWLLSDDPLNRVHAKDILLMALGETEREFAEKWKDHIIQPSPNETPAVQVAGDPLPRIPPKHLKDGCYARADALEAHLNAANAEIERLRPMAESWESYEAAQERKGSAS